VGGGGGGGGWWWQVVAVVVIVGGGSGGGWWCAMELSIGAVMEFKWVEHWMSYTHTAYTDQKYTHLHTHTATHTHTHTHTYTPADQCPHLVALGQTPAGAAGEGQGLLGRQREDPQALYSPRFLLKCLCLG
jgi:ABC-type nickel/cobalt efflux system permease component RcnA